MADRIQFRRDTKANWENYNPVLADGEIGIERDTQRFKLGDGATTWSGLGYSSATLKEDTEHFLSLHDITDSTYDNKGLLLSETYDIGCKKIYTYDNGYLSKEEFTDTDGTTVLLTITYGYDSGNLITMTRS